MKIILFALSIVLAHGVVKGVKLAGEDLAYEDYSYPAGSYPQQCRNCKVYWHTVGGVNLPHHDVKTLECHCKDKSNTEKVMSLDVKSCREVNVDQEAGELHCARYDTLESNEYNASLLARVVALEKKLAKLKSRLDDRAS